VLFNVLGALIWVPFIPQLAALAEWVSPVAGHLQGVEQLAKEVPRQIANAATIWATANLVLFLPFVTVFARMAVRIVPDRKVEEKSIIQPRYLDNELIQVPSMALERARMELGHMAELTNQMLARAMSAFQSSDSCELSQQHDQVVGLRDAVHDYLQRVGRSELSDDESDEQARLVTASGDIEHLASSVNRELAVLAQQLEKPEIAASAASAELLARLMQTVQSAAQSALNALVEGDERAAQTVLASRTSLMAMTSELRGQRARYMEDDPDWLRKYRLQQGLLDTLRRIYSAAEDMAISVLPRSVLTAELAS
jgi:phosphate:Na+ symporter